MTIRHVVAAVAALAMLSGVAHADPLQPIEARSLDLGPVSGVAYYTVEGEGFRVVATLSQPSESATPVRVETLLGRGQSVILSTPNGPGVAPEAIEISRQADTVVIHKVSAALTN